MKSARTTLHTFLRNCGACIGIVILGAFLFGLFVPAREGAKAPNCLSNLRQLATSSMMYSLDYDGYYPRAANWMDATMPCTKNIEIYKCPILKLKHPQSFGYAYNNLLDIPVTKEKTKWYEHNQETTPMCFDGVSGRWNAYANDNSEFARRHGSYGNVAYVDGHAKVSKMMDFSIR